MNKQVLLATYRDLATARRAVNKVIAMNVDRGDIGLATQSDSEAAEYILVTVTINRDLKKEIAETLESFHPMTLDTRPAQWRQQAQGNSKPDETDYTAIPRDHK